MRWTVTLRGPVFAVIVMTTVGCGADPGFATGTAGIPVPVSGSAVADPTAPATQTVPTDAPSESSVVPPEGSIELVMSGPPPVFRPKSITAPVGDVVLYLVNLSPSGDDHGIHAVAIGPDRDTILIESDPVAGGETALFTVSGLAAGEYVYWCTTPSHASLGQVGTLTIE